MPTRQAEMHATPDRRKFPARRAREGMCGGASATAVSANPEERESASGEPQRESGSAARAARDRIGSGVSRALRCVEGYRNRTSAGGGRVGKRMHKAGWRGREERAAARKRGAPQRLSRYKTKRAFAASHRTASRQNSRRSEGDDERRATERSALRRVGRGAKGRERGHGAATIVAQWIPNGREGGIVTGRCRIV